MKKTIFILALAIAACEDARPRVNPNPASDAAIDAGADAGEPLDAIGLGDAANVDGGPGNNSVRGTPLEGILIDWPDRLELCNVWRENRSLEDERADQAHVTLLHADRPSLGSGDLGASEVPRGVVRRGTLATEQFAIDPDAVQSNLTRYELTKNANDAYLSAEVEHNLGTAGVLYEELGVMRQSGDTRPVKVGAFEYEHSFALLRPGAAEPVVLDPCGGPTELDRALELATASDGVRSTTILRQFRTHEAFAGSFPVHLEAAQILFSDQPYQALFAGGWFSQTMPAIRDRSPYRLIEQATAR